MKEVFLQYIWKHFLFENTNLFTDEGESVEILDPGLQNTDAGPDFQNAKVKIGKTVWAGNVEVHVDSSSWAIHKHHTNKAYNNVILHVVKYNSGAVYTQAGNRVPNLVLNFDQGIVRFYEKLWNSDKPIACSGKIEHVEKERIDFWLQNLLIERLEEKSGLIYEILDQTNNSWEETFYIYLAKTYGFKVNAQPFEMLARSIPFKILLKHHQSLIQLEALLFGQAGFLDQSVNDAYFLQLQKEYRYLKAMYKLNGIELHLWKFLRLRPLNFPTIRIAQFALLLHKSEMLFSKIIEQNTLSQLMNLFNGELGDYWKMHHNFGKESIHASKNMGLHSIENILINAVLPLLFVYGRRKGNDELQQKALDLFFEIPPEKNKLIDEWKNVGLKARNAAQSQALIQLRNKYCLKKKCLNCQIAYNLIKKNTLAE